MKSGKKGRTHDRRPDDVSRNVKIETAISVIRNRSVDEESESDTQEVSCRLHRGREEIKSVYIQQHYNKHETHSNPHLTQETTFFSFLGNSCFIRSTCN